MKINEAFIDGYGIFTSQAFKFPNNNIVLISGNNEAGKSTLFSFLRGQISGYPSSRQSSAKHFKPLFGGEHGGSITVGFGEIEVRLSRSAKNNEIVLDRMSSSGDLAESNAELLKNLMPQVHQADYSAIFAFDLDELRALHLLEKDSLNEVLFSTVISGSDAILSSFLLDLGEQGKEIFRPRGKCLLQELHDRYSDLSKDRQSLLRQVQLTHSKLAALEPLKVQARSLDELLQKKDSSRKSKASECSELSLVLEYLVLEGTEQSLPSFKIGESISPESIEAYESSVRQSQAKISLLQENIESESLRHVGLSSEISRIQAELPIVTSIEEDIIEIASLQSKCRLLTRPKFWYQTLVVGYAFNVLLLLFAYTYWSNFADISHLNIWELLLWMCSVCALYLANKKRQDEAKILLRQEEIIRERVLKSISVVSDTEAEDDLENVQDILKQLEEEHLRIRTQTEISTSRLGELRNSLSEESKKMSSLLGKVSAANFESCIERISVLQKRWEIQGEIKEKAKALKAEFFSARKSKTEVSMLLSYAQDELANIEKEISKLQSEHQALSARIRELEVLKLHDHASEMLLEKEGVSSRLEVQIRDAYAEWVKIRTTEYVLDRTLEDLTRRQYSGVMEFASSYMDKLTSGRYLKVSLSHEGKRELFLEDSAGRVCGLADLSRGTIEQFYLSLRLALAKHYSVRFQSYPILLDDVIVNFDLERATAMLRLIQSLAVDNQQIIIFTCHQWVRDLCHKELSSFGEIRLETRFLKHQLSPLELLN